MTNMIPQTAAEAVANGAQLLDERFPGWWRQIDLTSLELEDCGNCVCGQIATNMLGLIGRAPLTRYQTVLAELDLRWLDSDYICGFNLEEDFERKEDDTERMFRALENEWKKVIVARLKADALPARKEPQVVAVVQ